jgi:hypothetical protein
VKTSKTSGPRMMRTRLCRCLSNKRGRLVTKALTALGLAG